MKHLSFEADVQSIIVDGERKYFHPQELTERLRHSNAELLWRYKAQKVIIQNLRATLTALGYKISGNLGDSTFNITRSLSLGGSGRLTLGLGQTKTYVRSWNYRKGRISIPRITLLDDSETKRWKLHSEWG